MMFVRNAALVILSLAMPACSFVPQRAAFTRTSSLSAEIDVEEIETSGGLAIEDISVKVCMHNFPCRFDSNKMASHSSWSCARACIDLICFGYILVSLTDIFVPIDRIIDFNSSTTSLVELTQSLPGAISTWSEQRSRLSVKPLLNSQKSSVSR